MNKMMIKRACILLMNLMVLVGAANATSIQAFLSTSTFNIPGKGPYLETYLSVVGKGITYLKKENGKFQGAIEVTIIVRKDSAKVYADRYNLLSPETLDTTKDLKDFIDQQRIP